ncbi:MAG: ExeA family protein [Planctomycetaceae bacterium]|jgi:general secretion pathway protein A
MHQQHWGLSADPFLGWSGISGHFPSEEAEEALLRLRFVVENARGAGVLLGEAGLGKTHLLMVLAQQLDARRHPVLPLRFPQLNAGETLHYLARELTGQREPCSTPDRGLDMAVGQIEQSLDQLAGQGVSPVFAIDDAHLIEDLGVLQVLRTLLDLRPLGGPPPTLLLIGEGGLRTHLNRLPALADRVAVRCELTSWSAHESADYVLHRLTSAGASRSLFTPEALAAVYDHSGGIPRRINRLCDLALLLGFAEESEVVTARHIETAAHECSGIHRRRAA